MQQIAIFTALCLSTTHCAKESTPTKKDGELGEDQYGYDGSARTAGQSTSWGGDRPWDYGPTGNATLDEELDRFRLLAENLTGQNIIDKNKPLSELYFCPHIDWVPARLLAHNLPQPPLGVGLHPMPPNLLEDEQGNPDVYSISLGPGLKFNMRFDEFDRPFRVPLSGGNIDLESVSHVHIKRLGFTDTVKEYTVPNPVPTPEQPEYRLFRHEENNFIKLNWIQIIANGKVVAHVRNINHEFSFFKGPPPGNWQHLIWKKDVSVNSNNNIPIDRYCLPRGGGSEAQQPDPEDQKEDQETE